MAKNGKRGRRSSYTAERHGTIVEAIRAGQWNYVACRKAGISTSTFRSWMTKGGDDEYVADQHKVEPREPYISFARDVRQAAVEAEERAIGTVEEAAEGLPEVKTHEEYAVECDKDGNPIPGGELFVVKKTVTRSTSRDWRAAAWLAERRSATRWAGRTKMAVEHSGQVQQSVVIHDGPAPRPDEGEE